MYHRVRLKMTNLIAFSAIILLAHLQPTSPAPKSLETTTATTLLEDDSFDNQIVDFDEEYTVKFNKKYGMVPWHASDFKNSHKYTIFKNTNVKTKVNDDVNVKKERDEVISKVNGSDEVTTEDYSVLPLELISTTEDALVSIAESTTEHDLTVIPLATTKRTPKVTTSTENIIEIDKTTESIETTTDNLRTTTFMPDINTQDSFQKESTKIPKHDEITYTTKYDTIYNRNTDIQDNRSNTQENQTNKSTESIEEDVPIFTELDTEDDQNIPEDYYDSKDVVPTSAPKTDAISVLFGLAGSVVESVVESVAEKVVPKGIYDLFKRIQRQNDALEAERLRSREENGGLGQFGRGILKTISTGISKPISQLMTTAKEAGSLDTDRGFVASVASSVTSVANVANSVVDAFKDKVQAIYPGTVWCGDGHAASARSSSELGLFFFTDTCCRQHDACKIYIKSGESRYGLNNTGLFTRSHCSCDSKFRECLRRTNSLVSAQIGLTYFNVLGPQCFRRAHPIVRCVRRTRITGQKCEEYELDYTKPKMWQWFDNETF